MGARGGWFVVAGFCFVFFKLKTNFFLISKSWRKMLDHRKKCSCSHFREKLQASEKELCIS